MRPIRPRGMGPRLMLDDLDKIDWSCLADAYGPARSIPGLIRALASHDTDEWTIAIEELCARICNDDHGVSEATPRAVPFLIELLGSQAVPSRACILNFLEGI